MAELKIIYKNISEVFPYINNPRNNEKGVDKVAASIKEFGFKVPIIIDGAGCIVAGHTRILAAQKLGIEQIPCVVADDLTEAQVKAFRIADNKVAEFSTWDEGLLLQEFEALREMDFDVSLTGFDLADVELIEQENGAGGEKGDDDNFDMSDELEKIVEPATQPGDVYVLGAHRLLCGDATKLEDAKKLMDGALADMIFTDPPYNVAYEGGTADKLTIMNDSMSDANFYQFLKDAYTTMLAVAKPGAAIYVCHADSEGLNFRKAMIDAGWLVKQCLIWVKNTFVLGRQDYQWKHEPILYGWKPGDAHYFNGGRKQSTVIDDIAGITVQPDGDGYIISFASGLASTSIRVPSYEVLFAGLDDETTTWRIEKPSRNADHPTMKPVALCARAIKNSSKLGGIVVDLFGGSGSTLIACEETGRVCYTSELDPKYCDVIVARWEQLTGKKAMRIAAKKAKPKRAGG
ncbi:DNA modification methylase [Anaeroselena agilis]|uniref:DNA modification methylase n=1 Tax=Anaeroselena agilis TaxID=3063788 RepID=A0ABU3NTA3_9FIRM|nr:DNA modification methylase [Selenomonadales bacterium 4137-cl]